jgi:SlyX protein
MDSHIIHLEEKIAYQEQTLETLDEVVCELNRKVARLEREVGELRAQSGPTDPAATSDEKSERPPHYGGFGSSVG